MSILADILTIILVLLSLFLILIVLLQRGNANGGMGAAMGGGMAEAALGAETSNVLTKVTRNTAIVFFVMVFGLGLAYIYLHHAGQRADENALPEFAAPEVETTGLLETLSGTETTAGQPTPWASRWILLVLKLKAPRRKKPKANSLDNFSSMAGSIRSMRRILAFFLPSGKLSLSLLRSLARGIDGRRRPNQSLEFASLRPTDLPRLRLGRNARKPSSVSKRFLLLLFVATSLLLSTSAQRRISGGSPLDTLGKNPSQETGWEILRTFRSMGWDGGYEWRIQLKIMPRREKTRYVNGMMYGDRSDKGPISRIDIVEQPADVDAKGDRVERQVLRLLLQSGQSPYALRKRSGELGPPKAVDGEAILETIFGSEFSLFDLMAPYVYWPRFLYEGRTTFRGSPTHVFWMYPPEEDEALRKRIGGVRLYINDQFNVLTQTEIFDTEKVKLKTIYIIGIDKADGQMIFREMDVRNEVTRDKTRLKILDAKMGLELPQSLFMAQSLMDDLQNQTIPVVRQESFESVQ